MMRIYESPEAELICLLDADVIRTSDESTELDTDEGGNAWTPWV